MRNLIDVLVFLGVAKLVIGATGGLAWYGYTSNAPLLAGVPAYIYPTDPGGQWAAIGRAQHELAHPRGQVFDV